MSMYLYFFTVIHVNKIIPQNKLFNLNLFQVVEKKLKNVCTLKLDKNPKNRDSLKLKDLKSSISDISFLFIVSFYFRRLTLEDIGSHRTNINPEA